MTIALFDVANTVVEKFERQVELDFSGLRTFNFTDTVQENSLSILTGQFELFGVDAGFHSGFFGPKFSDPSLTFTYEQVVEQQILDQIVQNDVIAAAPPVQIVVAPPVVDLPPPPTAAPIVVAVAPSAPTEPPPPPEIAPIQIDLPPPPVEQQQQEVQAEAAIEAQIEQDIAEPASEPEPEPEPEPASEPAKIAPSQRYSAASQTTTMVAMGLISPKIAAPRSLVDTPGFFTGTKVPDGPSLVDRMQNYTLFGRSNGAHNALVDLDWKR